MRHYIRSKRMKKNDIQYELIAKELTSDITEAELEELIEELGTDEKLEGSFHSLKKLLDVFFSGPKVTQYY